MSFSTGSPKPFMPSSESLSLELCTTKMPSLTHAHFATQLGSAKEEKKNNSKKAPSPHMKPKPKGYLLLVAFGMPQDDAHVSL